MIENKMKFLFMLPLNVGLIFVVLGMFLGNYTVTISGIIILTAGTFLVSIIMAVIIIVAKVKRKQAEEKAKELEKADNPLWEGSKAYFGEEEIEKAKQKEKRKEKVFATLLLTTALGSFALIFIFGLFGSYVGTFICTGSFVAIIVFSIIGVVIRQKISMRKKFDISKYQEKLGVVLKTVLSSQGQGSGPAFVVYRIQIYCDGKIYSAYSPNIYEEGEMLNIYIKERSNIAKIAKEIENKQD